MNKSKVISSLIYKFAERFSVKAIGLVISIILARLLSPEYFGQIAIINVFVGLSQTFVEGGLNTALVQSKEADDRDFSTVFYICMAVSALMVAILFFASPFIADYYRNPGITLPLRFYSVSLFFGAFNSIQMAIIQRELKFKQQFVCSLVSTVLSGTLGIALAFMGAGIWALVGYYFAYAVVSSFAMLTAVRWVPKSGFSLDSAKRLYGYGLRIFASSLMTSIYNDIRPLVIGRKFSDADLGYYDRGHQFSSLIALNIDNAVTSVMFPVFSQMQDEKERLIRTARNSLGINAFLVFPVMLGMAAVAEPMVRLLLKDAWLPSVIFIQILCIGEAQIPLTTTNLVVLKALGRSDIFMKQELLRRSLMLIVLALTVFCFDSPVAIAVGFTFSAWLDAFVTSLPIRRLLGYGFSGELRDVWKLMLASAVMAAVVYAMNLIALPLALKLLLQILAGAAVYLGVCTALRADSLVFILNILKKRRSGSNE